MLDEDLEIVKILALLTIHPNAPPPGGYGRTPIHWAVNHGHTEIVKILAPLTIFPNVPDNFGDTPLHQAAFYGYTDIIHIITMEELQCMYWATTFGHSEIVEILLIVETY